MKVIELLNKIANGEEVPKIIRFWEREYILDEEYNCYLHQCGGNDFIDLLDNNNDDLKCFLNDEVQVEFNSYKKRNNNKILPIDIDEIYGKDFIECKYVIVSKIKEIIDILNEVEK